METASPLLFGNMSEFSLAEDNKTVKSSETMAFDCPLGQWPEILERLQGVSRGATPSEVV